MNLRVATGIGTLVLLGVAVNALVWTQRLFSWWVVAPLGLALILGLAWLAFVFTSALGRSAFEGRAVGGVHAVLSSALFLGICIVAYAFIGNWDVSWDLTQEGRRELAPQTVRVLQSMTKEVQVICFFLDVDDELILIARDKTLRFLDQCRKCTELLRVQVLDPQVALARLESMGLAMASKQGTVVVRAGARQKVITLSGGSPRLEERDFTNALVNVLRDAEPKVCFLTGHGERVVDDAKGEKGAGVLADALRRDGYRVETLGIRYSAPEVPRDCDVLVINNVASDLHPQEIKALEDYLGRGGRILLMLDPWIRADLGRLGTEQLRPWLETHYGIRVGSDIVITDQQKNLYDVELRGDNAPFEGIDEGFMVYRGCFYGDHPLTRGFDQVMVLQAVRTVAVLDEKPEGVVAVELLRSTPDFWAETDVAKVAETLQAKRDEGEREGPVPVAVAAVARTEHEAPEGDVHRDARLVVVGDSDFASNAQVVFPGNLNFALNLFAWLSEHEELIAIRPTGKEDPPLTLTKVQRRSVVWISTLLTVQCVVAAGLIVYLLRRRNQ